MSVLDPHTQSPRELLLGKIRDPKTSARDLASLVGALAKLEGDDDHPREFTTGAPVTCPNCATTFPALPAELPQGVTLLAPMPPGVRAFLDAKAEPEPEPAIVQFTEADMQFPTKRP